MAHRYISLGSACNAATMIKRAGLRRASYPFDWLLNVDDGLSVVTEIVRDDFKAISDPTGYTIINHPPVGRSVPAYLAYPRTFHVHSDPASNPKVHAEMLRRFDRMRDTLRSSDTLHFVYYRDFTAFRQTNPGTKAADIVALMEREAVEFLALIDTLRHGKTTVLLIVESAVEDVNEARFAVSSATPADNRLQFAQVLSRYDDNPALNARWEREWISAIASKMGMPLTAWAKCRLKQSARLVKRSFGSGFR
ncbi:DUF1796 family putative cysteine peptidase [Agrobacterium cavarae]|uniref:DUF1796 family putative cysteine peptidase n=1 Tax=Agrobacterium cavarae TaxID=2528239 RepID=UPI000DE0E1FB|nr:DUF1796 family putative cysteine peptidase [Agrobacterium cavarae]